MIKQLIKEVLIFFRIDLTQNIKYDRLTKRILKNYLSDNSTCVDVGAHKGEILDLFIKYAPNGKHFAFEPIPMLFNLLKKKYTNQSIYPYAISDVSGDTTFQFVKNAPAYSGIKKRKYATENPEIEEINVQTIPLDDLIPKNQKIDLIKIDVEGGEFQVLKGAKNVIVKNKPKIIFECGKGASEYYGTTPEELYSFIDNELKMSVSTLENFLKNKNALSQKQFCYNFENNKEYYFIAY